MGESFDKKVQQIVKMGTSEYDAVIKVMESYERSHGIRWKTVKRGSFGEDDRPYSEKYAGVPSEVLDAFIEESEKNPPKTWKEAWERSTDWEVEHGVRSVDG